MQAEITAARDLEWAHQIARVSALRTRYVRHRLSAAMVPALSDLLSPEKALLFRITHVENLPWIFENGLWCQSAEKCDPNFVPIGNPELIEMRTRRTVPIALGGTLSDYVPFYFSLVVKNGSKIRSRIVSGTLSPYRRPRAMLRNRRRRSRWTGPPLGHRIDRIHGEIHDHLFDLSTICTDPAGSVRRLDGQMDVRRRDAVKKVQKVTQELVAIESCALAGFATREQQ